MLAARFQTFDLQHIIFTSAVERKENQRLALIVGREVKFIILTNVCLVCMSGAPDPKLLNYIDKVFWPYSPVKKSVKI